MKSVKEIECLENISWNRRSMKQKKSKGQLISECLFDILNFAKNQRKIWQISALEYRKGSNQQNKGTFLWYYNLHTVTWTKSYYSVPFSYDLTPL